MIDRAVPLVLVRSHGEQNLEKVRKFQHLAAQQDHQGFAIIIPYSIKKHYLLSDIELFKTIFHPPYGIFTFILLVSLI